MRHTEPRLPGAVLCGVDGGRPGRAAARMAADIAWELERPLVLLHAVPSTRPPLPLRTRRRMAHLDRRDAARQRAQELLDDISAELNLPWTGREVAAGLPGECLLERAASDRADLIVVGTSGRGLLSEAVLGSTSTHVVRKADRPVVVVPGEDDGPRPARGAPVMAALDGTPLADTVLAAATSFARRTVRPLVILHVAEPPVQPVVPTVAGTPPMTMVVDPSTTGWSPPLGRAEAQLPAGIDAELVQRAGVATDVITGLAAERDPAIVVVGSRRFGPLRAGLLGSVARAVLHAGWPIMVATSRTRAGVAAS